MKTNILRIFLTLMVLSAASVYAETPNEGAAAIRDLIQEKNYKVLFPSRYREWSKIEKEGVDKDDAIVKLSKMFDKKHEVLLSVYAQLQDAKFTISEKENPQISETGKIAVARIKIGSKEVPFKLYEMKNKTWGFHL